MTIEQRAAEIMTKDLACKDFITFLSMHARGNVLHLGLCEEGYGITALLYGVERTGGHVWSINPFIADFVNDEPFLGHEQWTLIESDPLYLNFARTAGVPEEIDLLYINMDSPDRSSLAMVLKLWGHTLKTTGLILVSNVKKRIELAGACEDYAKSYGMKFRIRQSDADLGVIYYPENKEALIP